MQKRTKEDIARSSGLSYTTRYVLLFSALLLVTNIVLGAVILHQSVSTVRKMVRQSMLNVSTTAATLVDGDLAGGFTADDVGTEKYDYVLSELSAFQNNTDIEYIYMVRQDGEDHFVFVMDADPEDPADFGEEVLVTSALKSAAKGTAMVDNEPAQDEWGNFYSAYSPVFDSNGNIACIIGVDYDADWYDRKILENSRSCQRLNCCGGKPRCPKKLLTSRNFFRKLAASLTLTPATSIRLPYLLPVAEIQNLKVLLSSTLSAVLRTTDSISIPNSIRTTFTSS